MSRNNNHNNNNSKSQNAWSRPLPRAPPGLSANKQSTPAGLSTTSISKNTVSSSKSSSSAAATTTTSTSTTSVAALNALRFRFLQVQLSLVGQNVTLTLSNGAILQGVLHTFTPFEFKSQQQQQRKKSGAATLESYQNHYVMKAVKIIQQADADNGNDDGNDADDTDTTMKNIEHGSTVIIPSHKVVHLHVKSLRLEEQRGDGANANSNSNNGTTSVDHDPFRTDTDISSMNNRRNNGDLVHAGNAWTNGGGGGGGALEDFSLEGGSGSGAPSGGGGSASRGGLFRSSAGKGNSNSNLHSLSNQSSSGAGGGGEQWDQFEANKKKFNIDASFDENLYTTRLDKTGIDRKKQMEAERLAREIEGTTSSNIHIAEERGHAVEGDFDEEDLYSGVIRGNDKGSGSGSGASSGSGVVKGRKQLVLKPRTVDNTTAGASTMDGSNAAVDDKKVTDDNASKPATSTTSVKKMNYAAAAASKTDGAKISTSPSKTNPETKPSSTTIPATEKPDEKDSSTQDNSESETKVQKVNEQKETEKADKPKSKLNPKAASFTLSASAAEWKPTFGGGGGGATPTAGASDPPPPAVTQPVPPAEPQHSMPAVQMQPQYLHYQHMPPPMMPYQPYAAIPHRVPQYGIMPMPGGAPSPANANAAGPEGLNSPSPTDGPAVDATNGANNSGVGSGGNESGEAPETPATTKDEETNKEEPPQQQQQQQPPQQQQQQVQNVGNPSSVPQQVPMGYVSHGGPSGYYQPGMPMPGRGPVQQYPPQMVGGPRQIPVQPGQHYYMPPMHQQNMSQYQMRGNFQAPYMQQGYNGSSRPGGHGGMEEDGGYRNNGGRVGRGNRAGGRRGGGRRGSGRGGNSGRYNNSNNNYMNNSIHQQSGGGKEQTPEQSNADAS